MILQTIKKITFIGALIFLPLLLFLFVWFNKHSAVIGFDNHLVVVGFNNYSGAEQEGLTLQTVKQEFSHQLPSMWSLDDLTVSDVIYAQGANPPIWKAKVIATIITTEDTYLPVEYGMGTITVVRAIYKKGVKRKLFARAAARKTGKKGWEVAFKFDNDVTLSSGLPLSYYFGEIVVEGSKEYKAIGKERLTSHIDAVTQEHEAALASLAKTHAAEIKELKREFNLLSDVEPLETALSTRIDELQKIVKKLHYRLEKTVTQLHSKGIVIHQWASSVADPYKNLPDDQKSRLKKRYWLNTKSYLMLGKPDNSQKECRRRDLKRAWSPNHGKAIFTGSESVRVEFPEPVIPTELSIFEVGNHGFVRRLTFHGVNRFKNKSVTVDDVTTACPGEAIIQVVGVSFPIRSVTIEIDADHKNEGENWFQAEGIDAVRLTGVIKKKGS